MISIMLISENQRELQILCMALEQKNFKTLTCTAEYQNYVKILQYSPDIVLLELPRIAHQQLHFAGMIRQHKRTKNTPLICYGDKVDDAVKKGFISKGIFTYLERPLKFSLILETIAKHLKAAKKDVSFLAQKQTDKAKDIELLLAVDTLPMKKIEIMTSHVAKMMAFPFTVAKVLQLAESEKAAAGDLAKVIEADPVLSAQLLKISNSVLFASINRKIGSVRDAIVRVGFRETKRLVMSMTVMTLFDEKNKNLGFDRTDFWYHSLACGIIAERLSRQMGGVNTEEAFLAGLLHDFGIMLMDEFFPDIFSKTLEKTTEQRQRFIDAEKLLLGVTHNDMLVELFTKWKIPETVLEGIIHQYAAPGLKDGLDTNGKRIALCVSLGDRLAKTAGLGRECDEFIVAPQNWEFEFVKAIAGFTPKFIDDIKHQMNIYREFLKLEKREADVSDNGKTGETAIGFINISNDIFIPPLMYVQKEGYSVNHAPHTDVAPLHGAVHMVLVWADAAGHPERVAPFSRITRKDGNGPSSFAPVVVLADETAPVRQLQSDNGNISFVNRSFDLRQLDTHILRIAGAVEAAAS